MAFYADEGEIWKCAQHPSKLRRTGVCPACLKQRLSALCPDCANVRPCSCYATTSSSSSSVSSSSSIHLSDINRASNPIDGEPALRRSRSYAFPFFRSARFTAVDYKNSPAKLAGKSSFWSVSWWQKKAIPREKIEAEMKRSRSVSAAVTESKIKSSKTGKGWHFPSPMKVFRQSYGKNPKFVHERSPLHRG